MTCESVLRVGGHWRFVTRKPDGREIVQHGVYTELESPDRFAKAERWVDWDVGEVHVLNELTESGGRTTLTFTTRFPSKEIRDKLVASGANRDAAAHYDKLDAFLERP